MQAMQATLAGEHAAVHVLGFLGGRVSTSADPELADRLTSAYVVHRTRRDDLTAMVRALEEEPVASEAAYRLPAPAKTADHLAGAAREVEQRCATGYASMVASTSGRARGWAIDALQDSAVRSLGFGARPEAFPGVPDL
jgi:hypothetical protein